MTPSAPSLLEVVKYGPVTVARIQRDSILNDLAINNLGNRLYELAAQVGGGSLVLNFGAVTHLSSAVLGKLMVLHQRMTRQGGRLGLCAIHPDIMEVFEITQLNTILRIFADENSAVEAFKKV